MADEQLPRLGIGMIGYSFMGTAHSQGWRTAPHFFDLPMRPEMTVLSGLDENTLRTAAGRLGWRHIETDWRRLVQRADVDLVDICTPVHLHAEMAIAALQSGKNVLCEKPLATTVAEAQAMADAAADAALLGVVAMIGFTYRRVPAVQLARQLVADGRIGTVRHVRAQYLQDWIADPQAPLSWRLDKEKAGSGALGDIGAHIVDLAQFITGETITGVSGLLETFVKERPIATEFSGLHGTAGTGRGPVTVDDAAVFSARLSGGGLATFEATRFAWGRKNALRIEINGSGGSLAFDLEDLNVLNFFDASQNAVEAGFRRILVTEPEHAYIGAWWPAGHALGFEHAFTHQAVDLIRGIAIHENPAPTFADGLQVQQVLAAVETSSQSHSAWTPTTQLQPVTMR